jgi:hypothetical protein
MAKVAKFEALWQVTVCSRYKGTSVLELFAAFISKYTNAHAYVWKRDSGVLV